MSSYDYFVCKKCRKYGGWFSVNNIGFIDIYYFLQKHSHCRSYCILDNLVVKFPMLMHEEDIPEGYKEEDVLDIVDKECLPDLYRLEEWKKTIDRQIEFMKNNTEGSNE